MFSKGQQIFAIAFIIVFVGILIWSYRKDIKLHKLYYKKVWQVVVGFILIITVFAALTYYLHN